MVVYEVREINPKPQLKRKGVKREVKPVEPVRRVQPINFLTLSQEWSREKGKVEGSSSASPPEGSVESAQAVVGLINDHLEMIGIAIHLTLACSEGGYYLILHDCSDEKVCNKVIEEQIDLNDLPDLLRRMKQQAGILLDREL